MPEAPFSSGSGPTHLPEARVHKLALSPCAPAAAVGPVDVATGEAVRAVERGVQHVACLSGGGRRLQWEETESRQGELTKEEQLNEAYSEKVRGSTERDWAGAE